MHCLLLTLQGNTLHFHALLYQNITYQIKFHILQAVSGIFRRRRPQTLRFKCTYKSPQAIISSTIKPGYALFVFWSYCLKMMSVYDMFTTNKGFLDFAYFKNAFCVNQHKSIYKMFIGYFSSFIIPFKCHWPPEEKFPCHNALSL